MLVWIASTIYLALALALCIAVLMLLYWAFTQLPARLGGTRETREPPAPRPPPSRPRRR